jgi:hypothetical protein
MEKDGLLLANKTFAAFNLEMCKKYWVLDVIFPEIYLLRKRVT